MQRLTLLEETMQTRPWKNDPDWRAKRWWYRPEDLPWHRRPLPRRDPLAQLPETVFINSPHKSLKRVCSIGQAWEIGQQNLGLYVVGFDQGIQYSFLFGSSQGTLPEEQILELQQYHQENPAGMARVQLEIKRDGIEEGEVSVDLIKVFSRQNQLLVRDIWFGPEKASPFGDPILDLKVDRPIETPVGPIQFLDFLLYEDIDFLGEISGDVRIIGTRIRCRLLDYGIITESNPYFKRYPVY